MLPVVLIRREQTTDASRIEEIHRLAFGGEVEPSLAAALRSDGAVPAFSLVAEQEGDVVGHVVCSRGYVVPSGSTPADPSSVEALGLGPIGVLPDLQRSGTGKALMHTVLGAADAAGEPLVALLGSPDYYRRFGFQPSIAVGINPPEAAWGEYFQVRTLSAFDPKLTGDFVYARPFHDL